MPVKAKHPVRKDLFCPECGQPGLFKLTTKAISGKARYKCTNCGFRTTSPLYAAPQILPETKIQEIKKFKRFIITSAVNDTPLVSRAHETFKSMAQALDACYLIIPGVYKNPDLKHQGVTHQYTWPAEILPHLCNANVKLNRSLVVRGSTRIQYTTINPLAGMNNAAGIQSEIYGHPQVAMEMVPVPKWAVPKMLHTTGSISVKNYGGSKQAQKAEFHHTIGAIFIEIEGDSFWPTQLNFDGDGVALFNKYYTPNRVQNLGPVSAISFGDSHLRFLKSKVRQALASVCAALKPKYEIYHDLHDHHVGSHHNAKDTVFLLSKSLKKEWCIRAELMKSVKFLEDKPNAVVVDSNHHQHLNQWFNRFKPHNDPVNIDLYTELAGLLREDLKRGGDGNLYRIFIQTYCSATVKFVGPNDRFLIHDIDVTQHGDRGPNGAKGTGKGFARTGFKTIIGDKHTPMIEKGCFVNGTSALGMPYAKGYSSWMNTHTIVYPNGKRGQFSLVKDQLSPLMRTL